MKVSPHTGPAGPAPRGRLLRAAATVAATLVLGLTATTAVALADDIAPGDPGTLGEPVATTLIDPSTTTIAPEPPATGPPTTAPPATTATTTEPPTSVPPTTTTSAAPATTIVVRYPGFSGCGHGGQHRGDDNDDDGDGDDQEHRCQPSGAFEPDPPTTTSTEAPVTTTTAPPTTSTPPSTAAGGGVVIDVPASPGTGDGGGTPSGSPAGATAPGSVTDNSRGGATEAAASGAGGSGGEDGAPGAGESAIAPFGQTALAEGGTFTPQGDIAPAPPFSSRLWAALPFGLLIGLVLVGVALGAVRIARLGTTP